MKKEAERRIQDKGGKKKECGENQEEGYVDLSGDLGIYISL